MKSLAWLIVLFVVAAGIGGMVVPHDRVFEFGRLVITPAGLVGIAVMRICFGMVLIWSAPASRAPKVLQGLGAILLLACFMAGVNYAYRWIFIFWMALWVWRQAVPGMGMRRETRTAQVACALLMFALWSDGALCFFFNRIMPLLPTQFADIDAPWRLLTQPMHWALMMLFAGWLLEGVLATAREWWDARKAT